MASVMVETAAQKTKNQVLASASLSLRRRLADRRLRNTTSTQHQYWARPARGSHDQIPPEPRTWGAGTLERERVPDAGELRDQMAGQATLDSGGMLQPGQQGAGPHPVGIATSQRDGQEYDSRHRNIIGRLDGMIRLLRQHPGRDMTAEMDDLLDAMLDQFCPENCYLVLVGFPQAAEHALRHRVICSLAARLRYRASKGRAPWAGELEYLRLLWLEHIELHDGAFEEFLAS